LPVSSPLMVVVDPEPLDPSLRLALGQTLKLES
jgi:hypothetical protein